MKETKKRFYPSKPKNSNKSNLNYNQRYLSGLEKESEGNTNINFEPLFKVKDSRCEDSYKGWLNRFCDEWHNEIANVNGNNALTQYNVFLNERLSYSECASLASDSIINNAITKYCNEILRKGGKIVLDLPDKTQQEEVKAKIELRLQELSLNTVLREAIFTSLTYGGCLLFIDINTDNLSSPLYLRSEVLSVNKIHGLRVIPPYLCGAADVETMNPLNYDFMKPRQWVVSGNDSTIHASRLLPLIMFESPVLLKPMYNYLGISLCQFMKNYVSSADVARQSLSDMLLRFKSEIIKTDLIKINPDEAVIRGKVINKQKNNHSLIMLTKDEDYIQSITPLSGLDKLIAQLQENVAVSARMPAVKLLGLTPSGFNATGDFDLNSYYDEIMSLQNVVLKPIIEKILHMLTLELGLENVRPVYEFELLVKESGIDKATIKNMEADFVGKNIANGIMSTEQGLKHLQAAELIDADLEPEAELGDDEEAELFADLPSGDLMQNER